MATKQTFYLWANDVKIGRLSNVYQCRKLAEYWIQRRPPGTVIRFAVTDRDNHTLEAFTRELPGPRRTIFS